MKLPVVALWAIAAGLTVGLSAPRAIAQAPADGAILEKDIPIKESDSSYYNIIWNRDIT